MLAQRILLFIVGGSIFVAILIIAAGLIEIWNGSFEGAVYAVNYAICWLLFGLIGFGLYRVVTYKTSLKTLLVTIGMTFLFLTFLSGILAIFDFMIMQH
jgi:hypothetical protein